LPFNFQEEEIMKVLLAVDGSDCSDAAVQEVAQRPWPVGSIIKVFSVVEWPHMGAVEPWGLSNDYFIELDKVQKEKAQAAVDKAIAVINAHKNLAVEIISTQERGHVPTTILDEAEKWEADLIVVGSHGYQGFKRFLLGSVAQAIASHAKCSVEIVRQRQGK
jgi:nucleotide-binding universal stress UspA family protein